jgi:hypothetical protein
MFGPCFTLITLCGLMLVWGMAVTLAPSNRGLNVLSCSFTPSGGSATAIKGVQSANLDFQPDNFSEGGDGDLYNTSVGVVKIDPMVTINFLNINALATLTPGVFGTLTFTMGDSRNLGAVGGGATIYTVSNACYKPGALDITFRQLAKTTAIFITYSVDGQTSPIAQAAA